MMDKITKVKLWLAESRRVQNDTRHGTGIRPCNVEAKIESDAYERVIKLFETSEIFSSD